MEETTDNQVIKLRLIVFIGIVSSIVSVTASLVTVFGDVETNAVHNLEEQYARRNNDKKLKQIIDDVRDELEEEDEEIRDDVAELKETLKFIIENDLLKR